MPETVVHELTVYTFGYTLFALTFVSAWATIGSQYSDQSEEPIWSLFHSVTPYMVCTIALISIILLLVDFF
jgi:hypothetical protein